MIYSLRDLLPREKSWNLGAVAGVAALYSFVYQVLPVVALVDLSQGAAVAVAFLLPATAALFAAGVAYSHNKRLRWLARPAE